MSEQPDWSDEDDAISDAVFDALAVVWAAERAAGERAEIVEDERGCQDRGCDRDPYSSAR
jgi:hypothetical protein